MVLPDSLRPDSAMIAMIHWGATRIADEKSLEPSVIKKDSCSGVVGSLLAQ